MTIEPPESAEKFAERIWQAMQEQYMEEVAELIRLRDLALTRAAEERMREKVIPTREELARFIFEFENKPGDAEWPEDAKLQPYCRWAYRDADKWSRFLSDIPLSTESIKSSVAPSGGKE